MLPYSLLMFVFSAVLAAVSLRIYKGKTGLIHSFHQERVRDQAAYGKAFGKAMLIVSAAPFISGVIGLSGNSRAVVIAAAGALLLVMCIGLGCIVFVQKKYNNGVF